MINFGLIGDGAIAQRHKSAISSIGTLAKIYDPIKNPDSKLDKDFFKDIDWAVICSPSYLHYEHVKMCLDFDVKIICEKPFMLPWQPVIDDDRINIVLQLRWADLPSKIDIIKVDMVRNKEYFKSWKGDPFKTGGLFYSLFIHYIDLALLHDAKFIGRVSGEGENIRRADDINLLALDMNELYVKMYNDIIYKGNGVKPKDILYLHWALSRNSEIYGFGAGVLDKTIEIGRNLL